MKLLRRKSEIECKGCELPIIKDTELVPANNPRETFTVEKARL